MAIASRVLVAWMVAFFGSGCVGVLSDQTVGEGGGMCAGPFVCINSLDPEQASSALHSEVRRLSRSEIANVLEDVLGIKVPEAIDGLPQDTRTPFDNDYRTQSSTPVLAFGMMGLSEAVRAAVLANPSGIERLAGCSLASGAGCLRAAVEPMGRLLLRRPISDSEIEELVTLPGADNAIESAALVASALVLDPEFLFRIERGTAVGDVVQLDGNAIANRLSFLLWGSAPDETLLRRASELGDTQVRVEETARMLRDPRAARQMQALHAMWLHYEEMPVGDFALKSALRQETDALVARVLIEEQRPWFDLFTSDETHIPSPEIAELYGIDESSVGQWVDPPDPKRAGILGHGSYLSVGTNFGDTSPTQRGLHILEGLLCREVPQVPDGIEVDNAPGEAGPDACKEDIWSMVRLDDCKGCHLAIDGIGFGLEQYGVTGEFRDTEPGRPNCTSRSQGSLAGMGDFSGPAELGSLVAASPEAGDCFAKAFLGFAVGRSELGERGEALLTQSRSAFASNPTIGVLLESYVGSVAFALRRLGDEG